MPSRISQMRNGAMPLQQQQPNQQFQINQKYLQQLKTLMRAPNAQQILEQAFQSNPQLQRIWQIYQSGGDGKQLFETLARQMNVDPQQVLNQLMN